MLGWIEGLRGLPNSSSSSSMGSSSGGAPGDQHLPPKWAVVGTLRTSILSRLANKRSWVACCLARQLLLLALARLLLFHPLQDCLQPGKGYLLPGQQLTLPPLLLFHPLQDYLLGNLGNLHRHRSSGARESQPQSWRRAGRRRNPCKRQGPHETESGHRGASKTPQEGGRLQT